jgi:hypothetical protein
MDNDLDSIARENFRNSGYITHPGSERRIPWSFASMPRSPLTQSDAVNAIEARRARAAERQKIQTNKLLILINALFAR